MEAPSLEPVWVGMAGIVYRALSPARDEKEEERISAAFADNPRTNRTTWRGSHIYAVTVALTDETGGSSGHTRCPLPSSGACEALAFGRYFGPHEAGIQAASRRLCESYARDGLSAFDGVNGTWAAVVWDATRRRACLVRDRLGIETLYETRFRDRILFATDLRILLRLGLCGELDDQALAEFLHYLYVPAPLTAARQVEAVLPGHALCLDEACRQVKYASPRFVVGPSANQPCDLEAEGARYVSEFEEHLIRAVTDCLPPDGRVALALSGGKDSSSLAVILSKVCRERVLAFNVGSQNPLHDEGSEAALVARTLGLAFKPYVPTASDLIEGLSHFVSVQGQPVGDLASLPYFLGMRDLPEDCRIIIDGTGNDYYFGIPSVGKGVHRYDRRRQLQRCLPSVAWKALLTLMAYGPYTLRALANCWREPIEESFVAWEGWSVIELSTLFNRDVSFQGTYLWKLMQEGRNDEWIKVLTDVVCGVWEPHAAFRKAYDFAHALGKGIRFPFTDDRLAHFVNGLPRELRFKGGTNKVLLRAFMARSLPEGILTKPKSGFVFDLNLLLGNPEYSWVRDLSHRGALQVLPTWNQEAIASLLKRYEEAPHRSGLQCRVYALCLLASVLALRNGRLPSATENS